MAAHEGTRRLGLLVAAVAGGLLVRLGTWPQVFAGGRVWIDGPDGYYHLRRAWLTLQDWPRPPQTDMLIGVPDGGPISWPPVFDLLLATLALPWRGSPVEALERIGAFLPPLLGVVEILLLYWVVRRLFGAWAATWAVACAAVLPGVVRYSLLGALDHDPLVEAVALVALAGLAGSLSRSRFSLPDVGLVAAGSSLLVLTWAGSILHLGLLTVVVIVVEAACRREERVHLAETLGFGCAIAAIASLPFVVGSVWTERFGATFIGLSWLHTTALVGASAGGLGTAVWLRRDRRLVPVLAVVLLALTVLLEISWPAFVAGLTFFGRGEPFLQGVMESQPLLFLFGSFDLRAPLVRLSLLLPAIPFLLPWTLRRARGDRRLVLLWVWLVYMLCLAVVQSRYAHSAALPIAALAGVLVADAVGPGSQPRRRWVSVAVLVAIVLPSLPAYASVPGLEPFRFFGRWPKILTTGMYEAADFFRREVEPSESWRDHRAVSTSAVIAPWSAGHWLIWHGRQGVVMTPLGPQGQSAFVDGIRFFLESDAETAVSLLSRRRVRHVVALAEMPPLDAYLALAGVDRSLLFAVEEGPGPWPLDAAKYLGTVAARLTWLGPGEIEIFGRRLAALDGFREVFRATATRSNPFAAVPGAPAVVPLVRVFEVLDHGGGEATGTRRGSDGSGADGRTTREEASEVEQAAP